jgi:hypothetical protein
MKVRSMVELAELGRALLEWARLKNRIKLLAYNTITEYNREMNKHILKAVIVLSCDGARDCKKIEEGLDYLFTHFEELKDKPLNLLMTK